MNKTDIVQKMAEKIVDIEFSSRHTWESCMETARVRAFMQATSLFNLISDLSRNSEISPNRIDCIICGNKQL